MHQSWRPLKYISVAFEHCQLLLSQALKERIERVKVRGSADVVFTSETEFSEEMMEIREDFVAIHGEMVLLKNYSSLNFAGKAVNSYFFLQYLMKWAAKGFFYTPPGFHGFQVIVSYYQRCSYFHFDFFYTDFLWLCCLLKCLLLF